MVRELVVDRVRRLLRSPRAVPDRTAADRMVVELKRLTTLPRYVETTTDLLGPTIRVVDGLSFALQFEAIVQHETCRFVAGRADPYILDCGANIGVTLWYWKRLYPSARVVAFEPDPHLFQVLSANAGALGLRDVELVERAVWVCDGELPFWLEGADGGRLIGGRLNTDDARYTEPRRVVRAVRLRDWLVDDVDLLKVDIEGAEVDVLLDCADRLTRVRTLLVEYHSFADRDQRLDELLQALRLAGFRVQIQPVHVSPRPFVQRPDNLGMDFQVNVFAYRV